MECQLFLNQEEASNGREEAIKGSFVPIFDHGQMKIIISRLTLFFITCHDVNHSILEF